MPFGDWLYATAVRDFRTGRFALLPPRASWIAASFAAVTFSFNVQLLSVLSRRITAGKKLHLFFVLRGLLRLQKFLQLSLLSSSFTILLSLLAFRDLLLLSSLYSTSSIVSGVFLSFSSIFNPLLLLRALNNRETSGTLPTNVGFNLLMCLKLFQPFLFSDSLAILCQEHAC